MWATEFPADLVAEVEAEAEADANDSTEDAADAADEDADDSSDGTTLTAEAGMAVDSGAPTALEPEAETGIGMLTVKLLASAGRPDAWLLTAAWLAEPGWCEDSDCAAPRPARARIGRTRTECIFFAFGLGCRRTVLCVCESRSCPRGTDFFFL